MWSQLCAELAVGVSEYMCALMHVLLYTGLYSGGVLARRIN